MATERGQAWRLVTAILLVVLMFLSQTTGLYISALNKQDNVVQLHFELARTISQEAARHEIIFIDDGSTDDTVKRLREVAGDDPGVTLIEFTKRFGQSAALAAGFRCARAPVIVPMDGDLQYDPKDIARLEAKLDESPKWDVASGWRQDRRDRLWRQRLPSLARNWVVRMLTRVWEIYDFGCSLKACRRAVVDDVRLYRETHRYLPTICKWRGLRLTEMVVKHRPRVAGVSKYNLKRTIKVLLDLVTVKVLGDYLIKPIYFFGKMAIFSMLTSVVSMGIAFCQKFGYFYGDPLNLNRNVLVLFAMILFLMSTMIVMMGVISELLVRIYHESQNLAPYKIRRITRGVSVLDDRGRIESGGQARPDFTPVGHTT